jgi:hypothetical protein
MKKIRISILAFTFLICLVYQPNWVYENFWSKADFYDSLPFTVPYLVFQIIYALITTILAELGIRFVKKYV